MTECEFFTKMAEIYSAQNYDEEITHMEADELMCNVLEVQT